MTNIRRGRLDLPAGPYVTLCVTDTGVGMTPEVVAHAFDPFFTTKPIGQGTGLGLSMIYGFVRQSGGQIKIDSEPEKGASVCIYLPRSRAEARVADPEAGPSEPPIGTGAQTVLVVDDEPLLRVFVTEVLEDLGYSALEASEGAAAMRILELGQGDRSADHRCRSSERHERAAAGGRRASGASRSQGAFHHGICGKHAHGSGAPGAGPACHHQAVRDRSAREEDRGADELARESSSAPSRDGPDMPDLAPPVDGLLETSLYARDLGATAAFYRDLFGFRTLVESPRLVAFEIAGRSVLLVFQAGATEARLGRPARPDTRPRRTRAPAFCSVGRKERSRRLARAAHRARRRDRRRILMAARRRQSLCPRSGRRGGRTRDTGALVAADRLTPWRPFALPRLEVCKHAQQWLRLNLDLAGERMID